MRARQCSLVCGIAGWVLAHAALAASLPKLNEPIPFQVIARLEANATRSAFGLSPDGKWLAHTIARAEGVADNRRQASTNGASHTATGFPLAEGNYAAQARLTRTDNGEIVDLGGVSGRSWAPVWSPDGKRVAFYADTDGTASVWIWEKSTAQATRFPGVIARPYFGHETIRWDARSQSLLCKILPENMNIQKMNSLSEHRRKHSDEAGSTDESIIVLRTSEDNKGEEAEAVIRPAFTNRSMADLAILDLGTGKVTRVAKSAKVMWYAFSPDEKFIAYTELEGFKANTSQYVLRLNLYEIGTSAARTLQSKISLRPPYRTEVAWSPDTRRLAYLASDGSINIVSIVDGSVRSLSSERFPKFHSVPVWDEASRHIYTIGHDGVLWRLSISNGFGAKVAEVSGHKLQAVITRGGASVLRTKGTEDTIWVLARDAGGGAGLFSVDLKTGQSERRVVGNIYRSNLDASDSGHIAYIAEDQQQPPNVRLYDINKRSEKKITRLNDELERYEHGNAGLIEYSARDGQPLRAALLLPPGYEKGARLPLVVWVYAGNLGSSYVYSYGLESYPVFNMQALATRGYAVLFPDVPLGTGNVMKEIHSAVMVAVDAAIDQGYADPDRLAVMGTSYGAYSTLTLITQTTRFRAAVISAAVIHPDLVADYLQMNSDGSPSRTFYFEDGQGRMGGTPWEYPSRYRDNSPVYLFDRIQTPVLIGQGNEDGRLIAADAVFTALKRLGKKVEYRIYKREGHVLSREAHVIDFWQRRLAFLDQHLKVDRDRYGKIAVAN